MSTETVNVAEYLFIRLRQLGCRSLHGLPGDFNLLALDYVESSGLSWVGNCNELNAGYAADAYARVTGLGAIMTTFGVGELSAVNAVAGSYAELAPVVHIVGTPPRDAQKKHLFLHHTLGNGDYDLFSRIYSEVTIAQANLFDPDTAASEIDRVLRTCYVESRPVYIQLPTDMVTRQIDAKLLDKAIDTSPIPGNIDTERVALNIVLERLYASKRPVILVDGGVQRRRIIPQVDKLVRKLGIPVFVAPMGKGAIDESLPSFAGVYASAGSRADIKQFMESSDLVITIGHIQSDLNTVGFTFNIPQDRIIALHYDHCLIGQEKYSDVRFKSFVPQLESASDPTKLAEGAQRVPSLLRVQEDHSMDLGGDVITHEWLWPRIGRWFRENDTIITDTGTSYVGYWESRLPRNTSIINQILWSSIGYGVGAAQGAGLAAKEKGKGHRTICFEGDGSFQLTAQELSTIIRHNLDVTIFLIENEGYTIERFVHGLEASYNDVAQWKYSRLPEALTPENSKNKVKAWKIRSRLELEGLLQDVEFAEGKGLQFVELHMPKLDAPQVLKDFGENAAKRAS